MYRDMVDSRANNQALVHSRRSTVAATGTSVDPRSIHAEAWDEMFRQQGVRGPVEAPSKRGKDQNEAPKKQVSLFPGG